MEDNDGKVDSYKREIIEMIESLDREDKLRYLYILIEDVVKAGWKPRLFV